MGALNLREGDFLVMLPRRQPKDHVVGKPGLRRRVDNNSMPATNNDVTTFQHGDVVDVTQADGECRRGIVVGEDQQGYLLYWVSDESYSSGISGECMKPAVPDLKDLQEAVQNNPEFQAFLQSPELQAALQPLKQLVAQMPERVPEMITGMHKENPQQLKIMLPFLLSELEKENPRMLGELMGMLQQN